MDNLPPGIDVRDLPEAGPDPMANLSKDDILEMAKSGDWINYMNASGADFVANWLEDADWSQIPAPIMRHFLDHYFIPKVAPLRVANLVEAA